MQARKRSRANGNPDTGYGHVPSYDAVMMQLNEYHGFLRLPEGAVRLRVGERVAIVPTIVCPVVNSFEELIIVDSTGRLIDRWPVDAQGQLN